MTKPDTESLMARLGDAVEAQLPAGAFAVVCVATPVKGGYEAMTVAVRCRDRVAMASFIEHAAAMLMAADPETKIHTDLDRP